MKFKCLVGLVVALSGFGAVMAPSASAQPMAMDVSRVFLAPVNIESLSTRNRTATLVYAPTMSNPAPEMGGASTSPEAVVIATDSNTLLTLPLAPDAKVTRVDAQGKMRKLNLKAASSALAAKRMMLRAEFEVASNGQVMITKLTGMDM